MKKVLLLFILTSKIIVAQQSFSVEKLTSRIRFSGESVQMDGEPNIGFLGHGYEVFGLSSKHPDWYFGVNSYAAITGIRSGFIVFGVTTGVQKRLFTDWLSYDAGLFLGGGGGSGAPDGGGLMIRPHLDIQANITPNIGVRAGVTGVTFPSGEINSLHVNVGLVMQTDLYVANVVNSFKASKKQSSFFHDIDMSLLSMNLFNYKKGPLKTDVNTRKNAPTISLLGAMLKSRQQNNFYGLVKVGGAFIGEVDGFMMLLTGVGYELPVTKWMSLDAKALIGGAGGGNVQFGGGLATQLEIGMGLRFSDYVFNVGFGNTYAPNGNFTSNHLDVALGKKFSIYENESITEKVYVSPDTVKKEDFTFTVYNRSYFPPNRLDKQRRPYNTVFNLLGFELEKKLNNKLSLIGATNWAYQGDYGAYAEGWLGLQYYYTLSSKLKATAKVMLGAGGGGAINLGSGMAYEYSLGIERKLNKRWSFIANLGQVRPVLEGNFTPVLLDVGMKLNVSQLIKK